MKYLSCLLLALFVFSLPAGAAVYEWTDDKGVVNFTDNPENIPPKYMKKVRKRPSIKGEPTQSAPAEQTVGKPQEAEAPVQTQREALYGGHDEQWWRSQFGALREELKAIQDALPAKKEALEAARRKMTIYTFPENRKAYYDLLADIEKDEARINELNNRLQSLDNDASRAAVPMDWRR